MEVIEQITYLLFIGRLDDLHTLAENKANRTGKPIIRPVFLDGTDEQGRPWSDLRWRSSRILNVEPSTPRVRRKGKTRLSTMPYITLESALALRISCQ